MVDYEKENEEEVESGLWGILLLWTGMILTPLPFIHGVPYRFIIAHVLPLTMCSLELLWQENGQTRSLYGCISLLCC